MELRNALVQIAEIRQQMARGQIFRGYRAATTAFSGMTAVLTGVAQWAFIPDAAGHPKAFVLLWAIAAAMCLLTVGIEMVIRTRRSASQVQKQLTLLAVEQFVPSVVAGALLTWFFCDFVPGQIWMLPGLWMILFSLGVFSSARLLPRAVFAVAGFYLLAGVLTLLISRADGVNTVASCRFSPWLMGGTFGLGQLLTAGILYFKLERAPMRDKSEGTGEVGGGGRFAYEGIDRVIHEKARLSIVASLASHPDGLLFNDLKDLCSLTDGNLSRHLAVLQEAGMVEVKKSFAANRPQTMCWLTAPGRRRFNEYVEELERVVFDAARMEARGVRARLSTT